MIKILPKKKIKRKRKIEFHYYVNKWLIKNTQWNHTQKTASISQNLFYSFLARVHNFNDREQKVLNSTRIVFAMKIYLIEYQLGKGQWMRVFRSSEPLRFVEIKGFLEHFPQSRFCSVFPPISITFPPINHQFFCYQMLTDPNQSIHSSNSSLTLQFPSFYQKKLFWEDQ